MSPQWMPQNLQKRLLLYILQQLLLFSEIDLPNLEEVSLSNIQLKDVSIDPEKVGKLPGFTLRYGELKTVEVKGGVVGGVNLNITGVELVLATKIDDLDKELKNMLVHLAQSTANLANTVMFESDLQESDSVVPVSDSDSESESKTTSSGSGDSVGSQPRPSALGGVMSRALDIALLRLQVNLADVSIKIISEAVDFLITVKNISFLTHTKQHSVKIESLKVSSLRPNVDPGHGAQRSEDGSKTDSEIDQDERSSDEDSADESLMSSTVFTHEEASSVYMSATAHSFSHPEDDTQNVSSHPVHLFHVDEVDLTFEGLSPLSKLQIDVGTIHMAAVPLTPTISMVTNSISKVLRLKSHQLRKQYATTHSSSRPSSRPSSSLSSAGHNEGDNQSSSPQPQDEPFFDKLHIAELLLSLTSAITDDGEFASSEDELIIALENINIKERDESLIFGGIEFFKIINIREGQASDVFSFAPEKSTSRSSSVSADVDSITPSIQQARADVRFEYFSPDGLDESPEITVLLSKPANSNIDVDSLLYLFNFFESTQAVSENISTLLTSAKRLKEAKAMDKRRPLSKEELSTSSTQFVLQTSSMNICLKISPEASLSCKVFPVTFNTAVGNMSIQRITFDTIVHDDVKHLLTIPSINFKLATESLSAYFNSHSSPHLCKEQYTCNRTLHIGVISGSITAEHMNIFKSAVSGFYSTFMSRNGKINALDVSLKASPGATKEGKMSSSLGHLMFVGQRRFGRHKPKSVFRHNELKQKASIGLKITGIDFTLFSLFPRFGDLVFLAKDIAFVRVGGVYNGYVDDFEAFRRHEQAKVRESLVNRFSDSGPVVVINHDTSEKGTATDIAVRKLAVDYYTHWIQLFERNVSHGHKTEEFVHAAAPTIGLDQQKKVDLRFLFYDLIIALHPGRLSSQIQIASEKSVCDFTFAKEQFYVKSSLRNSTLFLIDDRRNLISAEKPSNNAEVSATQWLRQRGFLQCGHANSTHIGITVNTDIGSIKARHEKLGIRGDLSLLDIQLNSDEHSLGLCADSFQTLIQLLNDLKVPVTFRDEEKVRFEVGKEFVMPDGIVEQILNLQQDQRTPIYEQSEPPPMPQRPKHLRGQSSENSTNSTDLDNSLANLNLDEDREAVEVVNEHFRDGKSSTPSRVLPMSLTVNLTKAKVYIFDGYDWKLTRKSLRQAVKNLEKKAKALRAKKESRESNEVENKDDKLSTESSNDPEQNELNALDDEREEVNEVLFQSIYLGMPGDVTASNLVASMNTEMQAVNMETARDEALYPSLNVDVEKQYKDLKLKRSKIHKVSAEFENVEVYVHNYTNRDPRVDATAEEIEKELVNKVEVRIDSFTVFDNVPSSSWNKLLTYMNALGEREVGTYMLQFSMMNVRPDPMLPFTEVVMNVKTLPLRLYVDQDTLMFLGRFFQFKDNRFNLPVDEPVFIQRLDISPVQLKFDYKPKSISYSGFKAGQSAELANLFILDSADLKLAKTKVYGVLGFPKLGNALREIYVPYIQKHQLAGLLSGLTPIKSIINIGEGVKNLVAVPLKEYKRNGQVMKSIQKSSKSLGKTTTNELLKLAVKLASGTQAVLESLEQYVGGEGCRARNSSKSSSSSKKARRNSNEFHTLQQDNEKHNLMQASQKLKKSVPVGDEPHFDRKLYSVMLMDDVYEEDDLDLDGMESSVLLLGQKGELTNDENNDSDEELNEEELEVAKKIVSLYSNQPTTTREGLLCAYKAIGKNLKTTGTTLSSLTNELKNAESFQEQLSSIARTSPTIVIRPMIGTTEAIMKTLMGLSNEIDPTYVLENEDKYGK